MKIKCVDSFVLVGAAVVVGVIFVVGAGVVRGVVVNFFIGVLGLEIIFLLLVVVVVLHGTSQTGSPFGLYERWSVWGRQI